MQIPSVKAFDPTDGGHCDDCQEGMLLMTTLLALDRAAINTNT